MVGIDFQWTWELEGPAGDVEILGDKTYHGVSAKDLLTSAHGGWEEGGHMQQWQMPKDKPIAEGNTKIKTKLNYNGGFHEPGLVPMLICADWEQTMDVLHQKALESSRGSGTPDISDNFPCG